MVFIKFRLIEIHMKTLKNYISEAFKINRNTKLEKVKFNIGDEVYILKRHIKNSLTYSLTYYEILDAIITDIKVINIIHADKTKTPKEEYKCTKLRGWTSTVFKTFEDAKQYCDDKQLKIGKK